MRRASLPACLALLGAAPAGDEARRLADAKREAAAAADRADQLTAAAATEENAAARARVEEAALATKIRAAEARVRAVEARAALVSRAQAEAQARLAREQAPAARLLAALAGLARRPAVAAVAQPGSVDDLVHLRAVLGTALPVVRQRAERVRAELAAVRHLQASAELAASDLREGRAQLEANRVQLAKLEARHRGQAIAYGERAMGESDRALALGERARDLLDQMTEQGQATVTAAGLADLPGPLPRPLAPGAERPPRIAGAYRLPVTGRLVTGLGEVSGAGVRSRGLTFAVAPGAVVVAPAGGVIHYARAFRGYGIIVVIDHGEGWSSLVTGLGHAAVRPGQYVAPGALLGRAPDADACQVTVELRRRGRPADIAALIG